MPAPPATVQTFLSSLTASTSPSLQIIFPSGTTITTPGTKASKPSVKDAPTLWLAPNLANQNPSARYMAIGLDLDAPSPRLALASPILHLLQADLTASSPRGDAGSEGWTELKNDKGTVAAWAAPAPPPVSAPHRYVILVWEQPEGVGIERVREVLGQREGSMGIWARVRWGLERVEKGLGLGSVIGGSYFTV